jgi:DNA-directed RNA polymerase subunit omega
MQAHLLEQALKVIASPQILVNVISKRVRQLTDGHRPGVEVLPRMGFADIALSEVIQRKLIYEHTTGTIPAVVFPTILRHAV